MVAGAVIGVVTELLCGRGRGAGGARSLSFVLWLASVATSAALAVFAQAYNADSDVIDDANALETDVAPVYRRYWQALLYALGNPL